MKRRTMEASTSGLQRSSTDCLNYVSQQHYCASSFASFIEAAAFAKIAGRVASVRAEVTAEVAIEGFEVAAGALKDCARSSWSEPFEAGSFASFDDFAAAALLGCAKSSWSEPFESPFDDFASAALPDLPLPDSSEPFDAGVGAGTLKPYPDDELHGVSTKGTYSVEREVTVIVDDGLSEQGAVAGVTIGVTTGPGGGACSPIALKLLMETSPF